jgi:hypothetical protein
MSDKTQTVDFGAPDTFGAHLFRIEIPAGRNDPVVIVEDYGYRGQEGGRTNWIDRIDEVIEAFGQQRRLPTVHPLTTKRFIQSPRKPRGNHTVQIT